MKTMYHITSCDNWESILKHGLVPQYGFLSDMVLEQSPGVYMFLEKDEVVYAMQHWFGDLIDYVYFRDKLILLEIQLPDHFNIQERFGWEAISHSTIPAEFIRKIDFPEYEKREVISD